MLTFQRNKYQDVTSYYRLIAYIINKKTLKTLQFLLKHGYFLLRMLSNKLFQIFDRLLERFFLKLQVF